jgi:hypothetical protein
MENETVSIWNKKAGDLTVKDQLKISAGAFVVVVGLFAVVGAVGAIAEKRRMRKLDETLNDGSEKVY